MCRLIYTNQSRYLLKALPVSFIKCIPIYAVNIQNGDDLAIPENRDDNFATGKAAAGNMTRKLLYIGDNDAFLALPRRPAHSPCRTEYGCMRPDPEKGPVPAHYL